MAERRPFLIFFDLFLNFCKANKNSDHLPNFKNVCKKNFYMGPHYVNFTFAFYTTLIRLELWPKYVAQAFLPPPPG